MRGSGPFPGVALLLGGALFVCAGCGGAFQGPPRAGGAASGGASVVITGVPFLPQEEETCGPSSLAMLLGFLGKEGDTTAIVRETRTAGLRGTLITDLAAAARRRGVDVEVADLDLDRLRAEVAAGHPVILLVDLGRWVLSRPHYLIVYGFSPEGVVAHSGRERGKVIPYGTLDARWAKAGRLALVVRRGAS